ncbi:MAG: amidohydrolase family protein [Acidobacteria bacterium]|nr:amidohydrolase family protein [Acidobacteriota bacterium]
MPIGIRSSIRVSALVVLFSFLALAAGPVAQAPVRVDPATLVVHNGKIVTVDEAKPVVEALAVRDDRIVAVGTEAEIKPYIAASTRIIDLKGALAVPGIIESHGHFTGVGQAKLQLNLTKTTSWEQIVAMVADAAKTAKPGEWISGRGWHQEKWTKRPQPNVEGFPIHASLSMVSPNNPVVLEHASGHATFANAKAMELAGITKATPNPPGGEILKDATGTPIGVFRETAQGLFSRAERAAREKMTVQQRDADARRIVQLAAEECLSKGVTTFHDAGEPFSTIDLFKQMAQEGKLGIRIYVMVRESNARLVENLAKYKTIGFANNHVTLRTIKVTLDGALGSRGAWFLEPYTDLPGHTGLNTTPVDSVRETAKLAIANGYQLAIHAIGDRANREVLNIYEEAFKANPDKKDLRWRDEHAQHLNPADIQRFGKLGVIAAMQGIHCTSDAPYVLARLGAKRAEEGAYVWQKLMRSGATISNGTDAPVEDVDPIANYYATVSRRLKDGSVFYGDQRMTRMEALKSYTINGAFAAFEEKIKGSLTVGKLGDVTILSKDILTIPEDQIPSAKVLYTVVGGKVLYQAR